jgi:hypothetical protein
MYIRHTQLYVHETYIIMNVRTNCDTHTHTHTHTHSLSHHTHTQTWQRCGGEDMVRGQGGGHQKRQLALLRQTERERERGHVPMTAPAPLLNRDLGGRAFWTLGEMVCKASYPF